MMKQRKLLMTPIRATVGPATDENQAAAHRFKFYVRAVIESDDWPSLSIVQLFLNLRYILCVPASFAIVSLMLRDLVAYKIKCVY